MTHLPAASFRKQAARPKERSLKMTSNTLFEPIRIGRLELPNRIVMASMTRNRAAEGNVPTDLNGLYYAQRATAGLIITEATQISPEGQGYPHTPGIYNDEQVEGWHKVTSAVHQNGGRIFLQITHVGRISHRAFQPGGVLPVAPSAIRPSGASSNGSSVVPFETPRALELDEIEEIVAQFGRAAKLAENAGFDGVEIQVANGFLIDQFLHDGSNHRTDSYGGALENRTRFLSEVISSVTSVLGGDRVGVRFSPHNPSNDMQDSDPIGTFAYATKALSQQGLAFLEVRELGASEAHLATPFIRKAFAGRLIVNEGYDLERAQAALSSGAADLVSFARLFLTNPDLVERLRQGAPLNPPDRATFYGGGAQGYTDYPFLSASGS